MPRTSYWDCCMEMVISLRPWRSPPGRDRIRTATLQQPVEYWEHCSDTMGYPSTGRWDLLMRKTSISSTRPCRSTMCMQWALNTLYRSLNETEERYRMMLSPLRCSNRELFGLSKVSKDITR